MEQSLVIHAVILEELCIVTKIAKKPVESPESLLRAIKPTRKGPSFEGLWLQNGELKFDKRPLWMPPVACSVHTNKKQTFKLAFATGFVQIKARNLPLHDFTSTGCA